MAVIIFSCLVSQLVLPAWGHIRTIRTNLVDAVIEHPQIKDSKDCSLGARKANKLTMFDTRDLEQIDENSTGKSIVGELNRQVLSAFLEKSSCSELLIFEATWVGVFISASDSG
jgi:hypothetical protein